MNWGRACLRAILAMLSFPALAQVDPQPQDCPTMMQRLPRELARWMERTPVMAASDEAGLSGGLIKIGEGMDAALRRARDVQYLATPEKPGDSASYGGLFVFRVAKPGIYRVALGSKAWVDILDRKNVVASSSHGHGPACSGIRKIVDFSLKPGRYTLQIAGSAAPELALMVAQMP